MCTTDISSCITDWQPRATFDHESHLLKNRKCGKLFQIFILNVFVCQDIDYSVEELPKIYFLDNLFIWRIFLRKLKIYVEKNLN